MSLRLLVTVTCAFAATFLSAPSQADTPRIVAGLHSADRLISDLEYMVVELAGKKKSWNNNLFPNIDIFLIGVDTTLPVRWDVLFKTDEGVLYQPIIPVTDPLKDFLDDNLDPIGIMSKRDRRDRNLYELSGTVFEGWLRFFADLDYVVISKDKGDIPKNMPHPAKDHAELAKAGYLLFAEFENDAKGMKDRKTSFEKFKANVVDGVKKTPDESKEAFELRKATSTHTMDILGLYFSEAERMRYGFTLDQDKHVGVSDLIFSALPDTSLSENIDRVGQEPSHFAALKAPESAVLDLRINFPSGEPRRESYAKLYELSRPVIAQRIDEDEDATDEEKAARKKVSGLIQDILVESTKIGLVDMFAEISKDGNAHKALVATRCKATDKIIEIAKLLPAAQTGWSVETDIEKVGDVSIHKLSLGDDIPKSLKDFYGDSGEVYLAAGADSFWLSGGPSGLETLKTAITKVNEAEAAEADNVLIDLKMQAGPLLKSIDDFNNDKKLGVLKLFQTQGILKRKDKKDDDEEESDEIKPGKKATGALANFEWKSAAIEALKDEDDTITFKLYKNEDGAIQGDGASQRGLLKAFGVLLAKFADENLQ